MRKNIDIPAIASQNQCVILTAKTIKEMVLMCFPLLYNGGIAWFSLFSLAPVVSLLSSKEFSITIAMGI